MKRYLILLLALTMLVSLAACGKTETAEVVATAAPTEVTATAAPTEEPTAAIANPVKECADLDEVNSLSRMQLAVPEGAADVSCSVIELTDYTIGQCMFTLSGASYTLRGACIYDEDISGVYGSDGLIFAGEQGEKIISSDDFRAARWVNIAGQYTLYTADTSAVSEEDFSALVEQMKKLTLFFNGVDYAVYDDVIAKVSAGLESGWESSSPEDAGVSDIFAYGEKENLGWQIIDVNGDNINDLLLGEQGEAYPEGVIYDLYTILEDGRLVHVFSGWERNRYFATTEGFILNEGSSGADDSFSTAYTLKCGEMLETNTATDTLTKLTLSYTRFLAE